MNDFTEKQQYALTYAADGKFHNWKTAHIHISTLTSLVKREIIVRDGDVYALTADGMIAAESFSEDSHEAVDPCAGVVAELVVEAAPVIDFKALIASRLNAVDEARERATRPHIWVYVGKETSGEIAELPSAKNVVVVRQGDAMPDGWKFTGYSEWGLEQEFYFRTIRKGPNVRRWV